MNSPIFTGDPVFNAPVTFNITICSDTPNSDSSTPKNDAVDMLDVKEAKEDSYVNHIGKAGVYQIVRHPKRRVLVINNEFETSPKYTRKGAGKDGLVMQQLWDGIGCEVHHKRDLNAKKILSAVKSFVKVPACFCAIVIMSHGKKDDLVVGDDNATTSVKKIVEEVKQSQALKGTPKLMFFQMCRGAKLSKTHTDSGSMNTEESSWVMSMLNSLLPHGKILGSEVDVTDETAKEHITGISDLMLAFATQPDHKAFRDEEKGCWFVQELARVFAKWSHEEDVVQMMERIKERVKSYTAYAPGYNHHECVASVDGSHSFGDRKLYLFPGFPRSHKE